jgi:hypothetical protein
MRLWGATVSGFTFIIAHEEGATLLPKDREKCGYTASYRTPFVNSTTTRIDGVWRTRAGAERACRERWHQIQASHDLPDCAGDPRQNR